MEKVMEKMGKWWNTWEKVMEKRGKWWKPWEKWWKKCENGEHHGKSDGKKVRMVEHMGNKNMNMLGFVYIQLSTIWDRQNVEEMVECWKTLWTWWKISDIQEFRCSSRANMGFQWSLPWDVLKLEYLILRWKIRRTILVLSKKMHSIRHWISTVPCKMKVWVTSHENLPVWQASHCRGWNSFHPDQWKSKPHICVYNIM